MFKKETIKQAQKEFSELSGEEVTEGTAEIWLQNLVDYVKVLIDMDREIKEREASAAIVEDIDVQSSSDQHQ